MMISSIVVATLFVWPSLRTLPVDEALGLVVPHFLRFIGLSFLVPGVVSPSLPKAWAVPAAYGDVAAAILAIVAALGLSHTAGWAIAVVWIFNVWGALDLLYALYVGSSARQPGSGFTGPVVLPRNDNRADADGLACTNLHAVAASCLIRLAARGRIAPS